MGDTSQIAGDAIVLATGKFRTSYAKTAHGLIRGSRRFQVRAVVDPSCAGQDAGIVLDGCQRNIPILSSLAEAIHQFPAKYCIVGVATHGGVIPQAIRAQIREAVESGLSIVNGLHEFTQDDPELVALARKFQVELIDVRKPASRMELHFWTGEITKVKTPVIAVLGTDCALGKRTTARFLVEELTRRKLSAEMIYTGQTGWMQGSDHGLIFDSLPNDFVSGELENAILTCISKKNPRFVVIEGQSSLRNPSGPCGAEFLLSGGAKYVVLQHAPGRTYFDGMESLGLRIPEIENTIQLIELYGSKVIGIALNQEGVEMESLRKTQSEWRERFQLPVSIPLEEGVGELADAIEELGGEQ